MKVTAEDISDYWAHLKMLVIETTNQFSMKSLQCDIYHPFSTIYFDSPEGHRYANHI